MQPSSQIYSEMPKALNPLHQFMFAERPFTLQFSKISTIEDRLRYNPLLYAMKSFQRSRAGMYPANDLQWFICSSEYN